MRKILLVAVAFLSISSVAFGDPPSTSDTMAIRTAVGQLCMDTMTAVNDSSLLELMSVNPRLSASVLIDSLHIIPNPGKAGKINSPETEHVLEIIRLLRFLTGGQDFCGSTKHQFGKGYEESNRKQFLFRRHENCLSFFGYWMSRDRIYVTPIDTQEQIISKWRDWYRTLPSDYVFKPMKDADFEEWAW
jgi:hypothetical protein